MHSDSAPLPLSSALGFQSLSLDKFRRHLSGSYCDHRIFCRGNAGAVDARHHRVALGNMSLNYLQYGAEVEIDPGLFETFYMLEMPLSGWTEVEHCKHTLRNSVGTATILSPSERVTSFWSADCGQRMVKISRGAMEARAAEMLGRAITEPLIFEPHIDLSSSSGMPIARLCNFLFDQHEFEPGLFGELRVSHEIESTLMTLLLLGQPNTYSDAFRVSSSGAVPRHVRRAIDYIERHLREDISMDLLAEISSVSSRALYSGFEKFIGAPPQLYIRNRRLEGVHEALLEADMATTVSTLAMEWGFTHLGRFSAEYRRRFGELPSQTLKR